MEKEATLREKSTALSIAVVKIYDDARANKGEPIISKRFANAAGAAATAIRQAIGTPSHCGDIRKLDTAKDELFKTARWAEKMRQIGCISIEELEKIIEDITEIGRLVEEIEGSASAPAAKE